MFLRQYRSNNVRTRSIKIWLKVVWLTPQLISKCWWKMSEGMPRYKSMIKTGTVQVWAKRACRHLSRITKRDLPNQRTKQQKDFERRREIPQIKNLDSPLGCVMLEWLRWSRILRAQTARSLSLTKCKWERLTIGIDKNQLTNSRRPHRWEEAVMGHRLLLLLTCLRLRKQEDHNSREIWWLLANFKVANTLR